MVWAGFGQALIRRRRSLFRLTTLTPSGVLAGNYGARLRIPPSSCKNILAQSYALGLLFLRW